MSHESSRKPASTTSVSSAARNFSLQREHTLGTHHPGREAAGPAGVSQDAAPKVRSVLDSPGHPLDTNTRSWMEPRFGYDFSSVRVHMDDTAARSAQAVRANAYTSGSHIVFNSGQYAPGTLAGRQLMAHELTHVVQQAAGPVAGTEIGQGLSVSHPSDRFEQAATADARHIAAKAQPDLLQLSDHPLAFVQIPRRSPSHLQRDFLGISSQSWADAGAVAGVAGGVLGAAALGLAIYAYARPPEALNPMPSTGGLSINPNPFGFNSMQNPAPEPSSNRQRYATASREAPQILPILDLRTDDDNHAILNVAHRTDGYNIIDASIRPGTIQNYRGGSRGSSANINFTQTQIAPAPSNLFTAPEPAPAPAPAPGQPGGPQSQPATGQPAPAGAGQVESTPASAAGPSIAEVLVSYSGTNTKNDGPAQGFAGSFVLKGNGKIEVIRPEITNGIGRADIGDTVAKIDYRTPSASQASSGGLSDASTLTAPSHGGLMPNFNVPNPPILDRP